MIFGWFEFVAALAAARMPGRGEALAREANESAARVTGTRHTLRATVSCLHCGHTETSLVGGAGNPSAVSQACPKCGGRGLRIDGIM